VNNWGDVIVGCELMLLRAAWYEEEKKKKRKRKRGKAGGVLFRE
jgi:hypothetical protein